MSERIFLDTNILIYAYTESGAKSQIAEALLVDRGTISVQVLNELTFVLRRKYRLDWPRIRQVIGSCLERCPDPRPILFETHSQAMVLCERFGYTVYDGVIIASALEAGCTKLYTEDLQHGQEIEGMRIVNPFLA